MGVYNRLGGKDGLVDALLIRGFDRLRAALAEGEESGQLERLRSCGLRYRRFALGNRHYYAIMFEAAIPHEFGSPEVAEHAAAAFGELVRNVEMAAAAGGIVAPDPREVAQQMWSAVHGAVALELKGLVLTPDPEATYRATLQTLLRGLAPHA
jgi:AcrR family transcriptional regulator